MNLIFLETILWGVNLLVKFFKWDITFSLITIPITNYCASSTLISCYTFHFIDANIYCEGDDAFRENYKWNCKTCKKRWNLCSINIYETLQMIKNSLHKSVHWKQPFYHFSLFLLPLYHWLIMKIENFTLVLRFFRDLEDIELHQPHYHRLHDFLDFLSIPSWQLRSWRRVWEQ